MDGGGRPLVDGGTAEDLGAAGSGGTGGADGGGVPDCPDLDRNGVADCRESLVINPDFKRGIEGWVPESDVRLTFSMMDGAGNAASGSLTVINASQTDVAAGTVVVGAKQCIPAPGPSVYELYLQVLMASVTDGITSAGATLQFYSAPDCAGQPSGAFMPSVVEPSAAGWRTMQGLVATPAGTRAILVRLVVLKPLKQAPTQALFDNVLLKVRR